MPVVGETNGGYAPEGERLGPRPERPRCRRRPWCGGVSAVAGRSQAVPGDRGCSAGNARRSALSASRARPTAEDAHNQSICVRKWAGTPRQSASDSALYGRSIDLRFRSVTERNRLLCSPARHGRRQEDKTGQTRACAGTGRGQRRRRNGLRRRLRYAQPQNGVR